MLTQSHGNISSVRASADGKVNQASNEALEVDLDIGVWIIRKGIGRCFR